MAKLTLQLSPEMERVLDDLAATRHLPKSQVLRRAMLLMQFLDDQVADNKDIVIKDNQTGELSRLVFESQIGDRRASAAAESRPDAADSSQSPPPRGGDGDDANNDEPVSAPRSTNR